MKRIILLAVALVSIPAMGATCKISEYSSMVTDENGRQVPVAMEPAIAVQSVTYTTTTQSTAFAASTRFIRIVCDAKAHFEFGTNPTAEATNPYVAADSPEYFAVPRGQSFEVAFYDGSS